MRHMAADETKGLLYVGEFDKGALYVVDLATDEVTKLADTDQRPNTIDLSPDGKVLYVSNRGEDNPKSYLIKGPEWGSVLAIDTATGKTLDAIVGGNQCTGLDVSPDGTLLAFSDFRPRHPGVSDPGLLHPPGGNGGRAAAHFEGHSQELIFRGGARRSQIRPSARSRLTSSKTLAAWPLAVTSLYASTIVPSLPMTTVSRSSVLSGPPLSVP